MRYWYLKRIQGLWKRSEPRPEHLSSHLHTHMEGRSFYVLLAHHVSTFESAQDFFEQVSRPNVHVFILVC